MSQQMRTATSRGLDGQIYSPPEGEKRDERFAMLERKARTARREDRTVVVVQGLGFVGTAMAAVTARARRTNGDPSFLVIGVDLPEPDSYWKVGMIRAGRSPVATEDARLDEYVRDAVEEGTLTATADPRAYSLADVVVVDLPLDVEVSAPEDPEAIEADLTPFRKAMRTVGRHVPENALVLVETTVPPGTTENVVVPVMEQAVEDRGLPRRPFIAHSFERVMPGPGYVDSIERFWRAYAGVEARDADRAESFLSKVVETDKYPLTRLGSPRASETAKVLENSYRATNIAFIHEWTELAEEIGVNLFDVIESIAVRKGTHDNIRRPGFGVGGYCLPEDGYLAQWGGRNLLGSGVELSMTLEALHVNEEMPLHTLRRLREGLGGLEDRTILVAGVSYLPEVGDTRNSPSLFFCERLRQEGSQPLVHDPWVEHLPEGLSAEMVPWDEGLRKADALVFAVAHHAYREVSAADLRETSLEAVVDTQDLVGDDMADALHEAGILPIGVGKGHWRARYGARV